MAFKLTERVIKIIKTIFKSGKPVNLTKGRIMKSQVERNEVQPEQNAANRKRLRETRNGKKLLKYH